MRRCRTSTPWCNLHKQPYVLNVRESSERALQSYRHRVATRTNAAIFSQLLHSGGRNYCYFRKFSERAFANQVNLSITTNKPDTKTMEPIHRKSYANAFDARRARLIGILQCDIVLSVFCSVRNTEMNSTTLIPRPC